MNPHNFPRKVRSLRHFFRNCALEPAKIITDSI